MQSLALSDNGKELIFRMDGLREADRSRLLRVGAKGIGDTYILPALAMNVNQILRAFPGTDLSAEVEIIRSIGFPRYGLPDEVVGWGKLMSFQADAVSFLISTPHRGSLLSLSPGLGKTMTAIVASRILGAGNVLVISPASLQRMWLREFDKWVHDVPIQLCQRAGDLREGWNVVTFDMASRYPEDFTEKWDLVIIDESIMIKNRTTKRFRSLRKVTHKSTRIWCLSGSPVTRDVSDLWAQFHMMMPKQFGSFWRFAETYCEIENPPWGPTITGSRRDIDFKTEFVDMIFARHMDDVLPDLPDYAYETIDVELTSLQRKMYKQALDEFLIDLDKGRLDIPNRMAQLARLQQIVSNTANIPDCDDSSSGKTDLLLELAESGYFKLPCLVWVHWKSGAKSLTERLRLHKFSAEYVSGDLDEKERDRIIHDLYLAGKLDFLVMSGAVGKYGLTLTNTQTVIRHDRTFSMDDFIQSLYRVRRIGLDHIPALITLNTPGTTDELLASNLSDKAVDVSAITNADLGKLLRGLGSKVP